MCSSFGRLPKFGRPRKRHVPDILSIALKTCCRCQVKTVSCAADESRLKARFAAVRVRTADGPPQRIWIRSAAPSSDEACSSASTAHPRRNTILPTCPLGWTCAACCDDQGTMDLRAGSSTAEGGTRSRSLRGKILARPSSSCADDDDCLRIPPTSPPHKSEAEKKSTARRLNRRYQPSARHRRSHHSIKPSAVSVCRTWIGKEKQRE